MQGIDKIIERIASDTKADTEAMLAEAKKKAEALALDMRKQADAQRETLAEAGRQAAAQRKERLLGVATMEARKRQLAAKQEMISLAFDNALTALGERPDDEQIKLLARLIAEASRTGHEEIVLTMADHQRFGKRVAEEACALLTKAGRPAALTLSASPRQLEGGGFMLADGDIEINGTYSALVAALKPELTAPVAKLLFG